MLKKVLFIAVIVIIALLFYRQTHKDYYDYLTMSGATPLAVAHRVPSGVRLTIDGMVKKSYHFTGDALNALATTRIRTREFSPGGEYLGAYIHVGIPVFNILEGIAPQKPDGADFKQPLDILVVFHGSDGQTARFSFNELIMTGDCQPVTLAFSREPLMPTNEAVRSAYAGNRFMDDVHGLRLICPREPDTSRYLDDVVRISYATLAVDDDPLPPRRKKSTCQSTSVSCMDGGRQWPGQLAGVARAAAPRWIRIGHGHGFDETVRAEGIDLRDFLRINFPGSDADDFFLFAACDGYRALFSGREIFATADGRDMMIADRLDGKMPDAGLMLAPTADYFSDRAMWGLAYVVRIGHERITR